MKIYFKGQGMIKHLLEDAPSDPIIRAHWNEQDAIFLNLLRNAVEPNIADSVAHLDTCKAVWDHLFPKFSNNISMMYDLTVEYGELRQGEKSASQCFGETARLTRELDSLFPISGDVRVMQKQRDQLAVFKFLSGLRDEYDEVRSQIPSRAELPSLVEAYQLVSRAFPNRGSSKKPAAAAPGQRSSRGRARGGHLGRGRGGGGGGAFGAEKLKDISL